MNWKRIAIYAAVVVAVLKFSTQIKAAVANVPFVGKFVA